MRSIRVIKVIRFLELIIRVMRVISANKVIEVTGLLRLLLA